MRDDTPGGWQPSERYPDPAIEVLDPKYRLSSSEETASLKPPG